MKILNLVILIMSSSVILAQNNNITGSKLTENEAKEALDFHNKARKDVGTPPQIWSLELSAYAQK